MEHDFGSRQAQRLRCRFLDPLTLYRISVSTRAKSVAQFVLSNIGNEIRLDRAAAFVHMEACAFSRFFSRATGVTFGQFVRCMKAESAARALLHSDITITELAETLGFKNPTSFIRVFRSVVLMTPGAYRKSALAELCDEQSPDVEDVA